MLLKCFAKLSAIQESQDNVIRLRIIKLLRKSYENTALIFGIIETDNVTRQQNMNQ